LKGWKKAVETEPEMYDAGVVKNMIDTALVLVAILSVFLAMWANYSGILRYSITVFAVSTVILIPAYFLFQNSAVSLTGPRKEPDYQLKGEGDELATLVKRSFSGYRASQAMLEEALREIMLERISVRRRMSREEIEERISDFGEAVNLVGDEELARLLVEKKRLGGKRIFIIRPSKAYREKIERIINKMEEWN